MDPVFPSSVHGFADSAESYLYERSSDMIATQKVDGRRGEFFPTRFRTHRGFLRSCNFKT
jgi:hypothetical protein